MRVVSLILSVVILGACVLAVAVEMLASSGDQPATGSGELRSGWEPWRSIVLGARDRLVGAVRALRRWADPAARRVAAGVGVGVTVSGRASVRAARATRVAGARAGRATGRASVRAGRATGVAAQRGGSRVAAAVARAETSALAAIALGTARTAAYTQRSVEATGRGVARTAGGTAGVVRRMWVWAAGATTRGAQRTAEATKRAARRLTPEPVALPGSADAAADRPNRPGPAAGGPRPLAGANTPTAAPLDAAVGGAPASTVEKSEPAERVSARSGRPLAPGSAASTDASEPADQVQRVAAGVRFVPAGAAATAAEPLEQTEPTMSTVPAEPAAVGARPAPSAGAPASAEHVAGNGAAGPRTRYRRPRQGQVVPLRPRITTRLKATGELVVLVMFLGLVTSGIIVALAVAANQVLEGL